MKNRYWFGVVMLLMLLISACAQQTPAPTAVADTAVPTTAAEEVLTPAVQEAGDSSGAAQCEPYNLLDEILAAPDPNLAPVTADDHAKGPDDAKLTILEFSDFQ